MTDLAPTIDPLGRDARDWHGYYAGFGSRFMAYVIDAIAIVVGFYAAIGFGILLLSLATLEAPHIPSIPDWIWLTGFLLSAWVYLLFWVWIFCKTPGMALLGLRVVSKKGERPGFLRAFVRAPAYLVSYAFFGVGFVWIIVSPRKRAWHDYLANTCVVYDWDARPGARYRAARDRTRDRTRGREHRLA